MANSVINDEMRAAVGRSLSRQVSFPVSESDIRRWAIAVYYPEEAPRQYWDAEYAKNTRYGGIVAPQEFNPFAWMAAEKDEPKVEVLPGDGDRTEKMLGVSGPGLHNMLNGGLVVEYGVPMRPGDVITSETKLYEYSEREGRLGLMLFTVSEDLWTNQDNERVKSSRLTLIRY